MNEEQSNAGEFAASAVGATAVCVILFSAALIAAGGWQWFQKFLDSSAPAWVQAVGSIAAILAAVRVGQMQVTAGRTIERARLAEDARRRILVIDALLSAFEFSVVQAEKHFNDYPMPLPKLYLDLMQTRSDALTKIDLFECPGSIIEPLLFLFPSPALVVIQPLETYAASCYGLDGDPKRHLPLIGNSFTVLKIQLRNARGACKAALSSIAEKA